MWVGEPAAELFQPGMHGTTFGGTPLACAAALAVLDVIEREQFLERVRSYSGPWHAALRKLGADHPAQLKEVRGLGYLVGLQLTGEVGPVLAAAREAGLLAPQAGGNVLRLLPPLTATADELQQSVEILQGVLANR
jgi:acetylornithine/N-succinyldiaminopimelate aminotransferase